VEKIIKKNIFRPGIEFLPNLFLSFHEIRINLRGLMRCFNIQINFLKINFKNLTTNLKRKEKVAPQYANYDK